MTVRADLIQKHHDQQAISLSDLYDMDFNYPELAIITGHGSNQGENDFITDLSTYRSARRLANLAAEAAERLARTTN